MLFPQDSEAPETSSNLNYLGIMTQKSRRKKHARRSAHEIEREFVCPYQGCDKFFGSEGSQNLHIKIKHNGGTKTDREKLAKMIVQAYAELRPEEKENSMNNVVIDNWIIDKIDLNLPPGILT